MMNADIEDDVDAHLSEAERMARIALDQGLPENYEMPFMAWMEDKWNLPHQAKIMTAYYDAINNESVLTDFYAALKKIQALDFKAGRIVWMRAATKKKLLSCIATYDTKLEVDIIQGKGGEPVRSTQRSLTTIYKNATSLMNVVLRMVEKSVKNDDPAQEYKMFAMEVQTLVACGFMTSLKELNSGLCHNTLAANMKNSLNRVSTDD